MVKHYQTFVYKDEDGKYYREIIDRDTGKTVKKVEITEAQAKVAMK